MKKIKEDVHKDFEKLKLNRKQYFDEFYNNNYNLVYKICFSVLKNNENSEDVAQNVFEKIYKLPEEKFPNNYESTWLYTVSKNEALQYIRKGYKYIPIDEKIEKVGSEKSEIDDIIENEDYKKILKKLDKKQEQIIAMKVVSDFTFKEIGEILSIPTPTVQWYYYKSINSLKLALSSMTMFLISIITGMNILKTTKDEDSNINEKNIYDKQEEASADMSITTSDINTGLKNDSESVIENIETSTVDIKSDQSLNNNTNLKNSVFIISGIFLVLSIIFTIIFAKHQQKVLKKSSK